MGDKDQLKEDYHDDKDSIKHMEKSYDILVPLHEYFKHLYFLVEGAPETEPVIKCEVLKSKAMKHNYEEVQKRHKKDTKLSSRYKQYP